MTDTAEVLADWSARLAAELGLEIPIDIDAILSLAGVAAHTVIRPAAPLTTFLVGYAAGVAAAQHASDAETGPSEAIETAMASARSLLLRAAASDTAVE